MKMCLTIDQWADRPNRNGGARGWMAPRPSTPRPSTPLPSTPRSSTPDTGAPVVPDLDASPGQSPSTSKASTSMKLPVDDGLRVPSTVIVTVCGPFPRPACSRSVC